jgi:GxxExxY protein
LAPPSTSFFAESDKDVDAGPAPGMTDESHPVRLGMNLLSNRIIGCALTVLHALGTGFLEKVYENALVHELRKSGLAVSQQHPMVVRYDGIVVGEYSVDLLVEHIVLVELKVARAIDDIHRAQCLNYLKATGLHLCLLLNFGKPRLEIKRIVLGL